MWVIASTSAVMVIGLLMAVVVIGGVGPLAFVDSVNVAASDVIDVVCGVVEMVASSPIV